MATIKISYKLDETGRRASLLAGGDGREHQTVEVPATPELLAIASIATDGSASYSLTRGLPGRGSIDYAAPIADPATVALAHAAALAHAETQAAEQRETERREADEDLARKDAAKAARTAEWRALAARYLAGEDLSVQTERSTTIVGIRADETSVTVAEWQAVDREHERRAKLEAGRVAGRKLAEALILRAAWLTWLREHGAATDVLERCEAGLLPLDEGTTIVRDALLPATIGEAAEYETHDAGDIEHDSDCAKCGDARCEWTVDAADGVPLTAEQWTVLKAVRAHYAGTTATVDVRAHTAVLSCNCVNTQWLVARVRLALPELALTVRRQYAL